MGFAVGDRVTAHTGGCAGDSNTYDSDGVTVYNATNYLGTIRRLWHSEHLADENNELYYSKPQATVDLDIGTTRVFDIANLIHADALVRRS